MAQGRLQQQRSLVLAQAGVLFFEGGEGEIEEFIRTGSLETGKRNVAPCNTMVLEAMQRAADMKRDKGKQHAGQRVKGRDGRKGRR